jgi:hypothetical protein
MKILPFVLVITVSLFTTVAVAQKKTAAPTSCKIILDGKAITDVTLENAVAWCELTPPAVQCDDGKTYQLNSFQVNFFTLKPLQNREFGIGEGGIPILAREAIAKGMPGDAIVLKEVKALAVDGNVVDLPVISIKIK